MTPPFPASFNDVAIGLAPDDVGGAYVLSAWTQWQVTTTGPFHLSHVTELGVRDATIQFDDARGWIGAASYCSEAAVVPGPGGHCYLAWAHDWATDDLRVQRYDRTLAPQWVAPTIACPTYPGYFQSSSLVAEHDCNDGILLAWRQWQGPAATHDIRVQRVDANGNVLWGTNGVTVAQSSLAPNIQPANGRALPAWLQLVSRSNGGAFLVWQEPAKKGLVDILMQTISPAGKVSTKPPQVIGRGRDLDWRTVTPLCRIVRTIADTFILAFADEKGHLQCVQRSLDPRFVWQQDLGKLVHRHGFHVEHELGGVRAQVGALIAVAVPGGYLSHRVFYNSPPTLPSPLLPGTHPSSLAPPDVWARSAYSFPNMTQSGNIVVFQDWQPGGARLKTACIDFTGAIDSPIQDLTTGGLSQDLPTGIPLSQPRTGPSAMVAWSAGFPGGVDGQDTWAMRVGCCFAFDPGGIDVGPELPCAIVETPGLPWGEFAVSFPCGDRGREFGLLPLSRLAKTVPGLAVPGIFNNRGGALPEWVRIRLRGLPPHISLTLMTQRGKALADAERVGDDAQDQCTLTFRPSPSQDLVLVFHRRQSGRAKAPGSVGIDVTWGMGKAPSVDPAGEEPRARKARTRRRR